MPLLGSITKQPREVLDCDINYGTALQGRTDTIEAGSQVEVTPSEVGGVEVDFVITEHPIVKIILSGGLHVTGQYKVTILTNIMPTGLVFEDELNVIVQEL